MQGNNHDQKQKKPGLREMSEDTLLQVENLVKEFKLEKPGFLSGKLQILRAVDEVSFDIRCGETFGLVGESGCGKSTIARCILQLIPPTSGQVLFKGKELGALEKEELRRLRGQMQIVFQDPHASLDSRMSVREIVAEPLIVHGVKERQKRTELANEMLKQVGILPEQANRKPHAFSGGQQQRIGIARAIILNPELVILDEPVSSLDVSIQAQVLNLLREIQKKLELTYIFIVHDLILAEYFCDRLVVLYLGAMMEMASSEVLFDNPLHPYTVALLSAVPVPDPKSESWDKRIILSGDVSTPTGKNFGCRFRSRCPVGKDREICHNKEPKLEELTKDHWVACHFPGEL